MEPGHIKIIHSLLSTEAELMVIQLASVVL